MDYITFPIFRSLIFPMLVFGMPRTLFIFTATMTVAIVFSLGQFWFIRDHCFASNNL